MDNSKWYGQHPRGGGGDSKQTAFLVGGAVVLLLVLLAWSRLGLGGTSVPSLPAASVEDTLPESTAVPVVDALLFLNCVAPSGELWRSTYRQDELSGAGSPGPAASRQICGDPARRVP